MSESCATHLTSILTQTLRTRFGFRRSWLGICHRVELGDGRVARPAQEKVRASERELETERLLDVLGDRSVGNEADAQDGQRSARAASCIATPMTNSMTAAARPASETCVFMVSSSLVEDRQTRQSSSWTSRGRNRFKAPVEQNGAGESIRFRRRHVLCDGRGVTRAPRRQYYGQYQKGPAAMQP
jgi:hypothetical protein